MRELSLNIMDIAQNSISAGASLIEIEVAEDIGEDVLKIRVTDNGDVYKRQHPRLLGQ